MLIGVLKSLPAHFLLLFLKPHEELLGVTPDLGAGASPDVLLNHPPVFAEESESFEEPLVLGLSPTAMLRHFVGTGETILGERVACA